MLKANDRHGGVVGGDGWIAVAVHPINGALWIESSVEQVEDPKLFQLGMRNVMRSKEVRVATSQKFSRIAYPLAPGG